MIDMKAVRIDRYGPPEVVFVEEIPKPMPDKGEVLVRVAAAGVAPWDAIIREGKSKVSQQPPLTLGSDLSGFVEAVGPDVRQFAIGEAVYGVTNPQFCGAQAEFAIALAGMIAPKPPRLNHLEAASAPVVAVAAWQMLFEYAQAKSGDTILITGAAGNVGAYAVEMALDAGMRVVAVARSTDQEMLRALGVEIIIDSSAPGFGSSLPQVDAVLDTVGGETAQQCFSAVKEGGGSCLLSPRNLHKGRGSNRCSFTLKSRAKDCARFQTCLRGTKFPPRSDRCCRSKKRARRTRCLPAHHIRGARSFFRSSAERERALNQSGGMRRHLDANVLLLVDAIFPPVRDAQDGSRWHLRQRLMQLASRCRSVCRQLRKPPASSSQASVAAGPKATFAVRS